MKYVSKVTRDGIIKEMRDARTGKILKEVVVKGVKYQRNTVWKTYNSIKNNELLRIDLE